MGIRVVAMKAEPLIGEHSLAETGLTRSDIWRFSLSFSLSVSVEPYHLLSLCSQPSQPGPTEGQRNPWAHLDFSPSMQFHRICRQHGKGVVRLTVEISEAFA